MPSYDAGISSRLPERSEDARAWLARVALAMEEQRIGQSAPCMNPECGRPVDYTGHGAAPRYCSTTCRTKVSKMRARARQQLEVLDGLLEATKNQSGVPREDLRTRANLLRWWLTRLG